MCPQKIYKTKIFLNTLRNLNIIVKWICSLLRLYVPNNYKLDIFVGAALKGALENRGSPRYNKTICMNWIKWLMTWISFFSFQVFIKRKFMLCHFKIIWLKLKQEKGGTEYPWIIKLFAILKVLTKWHYLIWKQSLHSMNIVNHCIKKTIQS